MYNGSKITSVFIAYISKYYYLCSTNNNNNNSNSNMKKYSINPKLNKCLNGIETALLSILDTKAESLEQIRAYVREYRNEPDCNIAQHGNVLYTYAGIRDFYRSCGYKSMDNMSDGRIWATYLHQVGYVARQLVRTSK